MGLFPIFLPRHVIGHGGPVAVIGVILPVSFILCQYGNTRLKSDLDYKDAGSNILVKEKPDVSNFVFFLFFLIFLIFLLFIVLFSIAGTHDSNVEKRPDFCEVFFLCFFLIFILFNFFSLLAFMTAMFSPLLAFLTAMLKKDSTSPKEVGGHKKIASSDNSTAIANAQNRYIL